MNHADLCRINGVAGQYADLLEEAGVDTVVELSRRNPANLATAIAETNFQEEPHQPAAIGSDGRGLGGAGQGPAAGRVLRERPGGRVERVIADRPGDT